MCVGRGVDRGGRREEGGGRWGRKEVGGREEEGGQEKEGKRKGSIRIIMICLLYLH